MYTTRYAHWASNQTGIHRIYGSNSKVSSGRRSLSSIAELIVWSDRFDGGTRSVAEAEAEAEGRL